MSDWDNSNMGEKIQSFVEDAVNSMDFEMLNRNINSSIQSVFEELNIGQPKVRYHSGTGSNGTKAVTKNQTTAVGSPLYVKNPPGSISGTICTAIGGTFTGIFGFCIVLLASLTAAIPDMALANNIAQATLVPLLIVSMLVLGKGISLRGRAKRFKSYVHVIGRKTYCQIKELAAAVGKSEKFVVKDVQKMIENRFFLNGHMDSGHTCLMLDDKTYQQYLDTQQAYHERVLEMRKQQQSDRAVFSSDNISNPELVKAIEEGNRYILQIRRANDAIPGEEISEKLFRLEALIKKIFEVLKKKPDQLPKLRKFMNYYMPTTLKLVQAYQELDAQPVAGENILKSKADIEKTMDTINLAYEKLLDSFFEDAAMDISTDISVLETMFAQEGLTKSHFE